MYVLPFLPSSDMLMLGIIKNNKGVSGSFASITHLTLRSHVVGG